MRALDTGAVVQFTLYRNGSAVATALRSYAANELPQESFENLFATTAATNDSIGVDVISGAAIPYAAIVNNSTQETSFQRGRRME